jgi:hypothetical protein
MKLVRLESDNPVTESEFTNNLAIAVQLDQNAKVALKTLSLEFDKPKLEINSTNDTIRFGIATDPNVVTRAVKLQRGFYIQRDLDLEIFKRINEMVQSTNSLDESLIYEIGSEWMVETFLDAATNGLKIEIVYIITDPLELTGAYVTGDMQVNGNMFIKEPGTDDNTYNAYLVTNDFICQGGWMIEMQINEQEAGQVEDIKDSDWILYMGPEHRDVTEEDIILNSKVAIMRNSLGKYSYLKDGEMQATATDILDGDIIRISKTLINDDTKMQVQYEISNGTETRIIFDGDIIVDNLQIFNDYVILKAGNDTGKIEYNNITFTPSGLNREVNGVYSRKTVKDMFNKIRNINIKAPPINVTIDFVTRALSTLLGFDNLVYFRNGIESTFTGEREMYASVFTNDLIVEIPELNLNTYDHSYKQKRNIIMVIPSGDLKNAITARGFNGYELSYTDVYPTFISLQNKQTTLTYSQLTVRVTSRKQLLSVDGKMSCMLLFKDELGE